jgi:spermidine synthase
MHLTFTEMHTPRVGLMIEVERQLCSEQSPFQLIEIFESKEFGRFLALDGFMMCAEKDEFIYHEMMTHVPMAVNPSIERVLVIGGGDGGVVRELCRYDGIMHIDLVEIDRRVVELCEEYLPSIACKLRDPRVTIHYQDGMRFVRSRENAYDLIIVDSTDPFGPGEGLFTREFYGHCHTALREDGILVNQNESPFYEEDAMAMQRAHKRIAATFPVCRLYQAHIPSYPSGHWMFGFASKGLHPVRSLQAAAWRAVGIPARYYNTNLHRAAFALPTYVEEIVKHVE